MELLDVDADEPPLIALRLAAGLTLAVVTVVADAAGLSLSAYTRLEKGVVRRDPEPAVACSNAAVLGVSSSAWRRAWPTAAAHARSRSARSPE